MQLRDAWDPHPRLGAIFQRIQTGLVRRVGTFRSTLTLDLWGGQEEGLEAESVLNWLLKWVGSQLVGVYTSWRQCQD